MARKRKGRDVSGWLVIDKPAGITSTAVVNKIRWALQAKKAGHAGTLDPEATGVLAVALGEATKTIPFVTEALKAYRFTVRLGAATNSDDAEGEVIKTSDLRPGDAEIKAQLGRFVGDIQQIPPQFSAVKIDGQRAYVRARAGEAIDIQPRPLWVEELVLTDRPDANHVTLEMTCGKGGYVRSIARDLGEALGCYGHVKCLRRLWSGPFDVAQGLGLEVFSAETPPGAALDAHLLPLELGLADLPEIRTNAAGARLMRNGNPGQIFGDANYGDVAWASYEGHAVAVGTVRGAELHPSRVFKAPGAADAKA